MVEYLKCYNENEMASWIYNEKKIEINVPCLKSANVNDDGLVQCFTEKKHIRLEEDSRIKGKIKKTKYECVNYLFSPEGEKIFEVNYFDDYFMWIENGIERKHALKKGRVRYSLKNNVILWLPYEDTNYNELHLIDFNGETIKILNPPYEADVIDLLYVNLGI